MTFSLIEPSLLLRVQILRLEGFFVTILARAHTETVPTVSIYLADRHRNNCNTTNSGQHAGSKGIPRGYTIYSGGAKVTQVTQSITENISLIQLRECDMHCKWNFHDNAAMEGEEIQPQENSVLENCATKRKTEKISN